MDAPLRWLTKTAAGNDILLELTRAAGSLTVRVIGPSLAVYKAVVTAAERPSRFSGKGEFLPAVFQMFSDAAAPPAAAASSGEASATRYSVEVTLSTDVDAYIVRLKHSRGGVRQLDLELAATPATERGSDEVWRLLLRVHSESASARAAVGARDAEVADLSRRINELQKEVSAAAATVADLEKTMISKFRVLLNAKKEVIVGLEEEVSRLAVDLDSSKQELKGVKLESERVKAAALIRQAEMELADGGADSSRAPPRGAASSSRNKKARVAGESFAGSAHGLGQLISADDDDDDGGDGDAAAGEEEEQEEEVELVESDSDNEGRRLRQDAGRDERGGSSHAAGSSSAAAQSSRSSASAAAFSSSRFASSSAAAPHQGADDAEGFSEPAAEMEELDFS